MTEPDYELIERWTADLRSGKYEQGKAYLRRTGDDGVDRYCCLGRLADLIDPEGYAEVHEGVFGWRKNVAILDADTALSVFGEGLGPKPLTIGPVVDIGGIVGTLIEHNDMGRTFPEIADAIDAWVAERKAASS